MELTKAQRALLTMPSRWPPIMLGIVLSLFISAIFTFNFAMRVMPVSEATSPTSSDMGSPSSAATITAFPSQLFMLLFKSSSTRAPKHPEGNRNSGTPEVFASPSEENAGENDGDTGSVSSSPFAKTSSQFDALLESNKHAHPIDSVALQDSPVPVPPSEKPDPMPTSLNCTESSMGCNVSSQNTSAESNLTKGRDSSAPQQQVRASKGAASVSSAPLSSEMVMGDQISRLGSKTTTDARIGNKTTTDALQTIDQSLFEKKATDMDARHTSKEKLPSTRPLTTLSTNSQCDISIGKWVEDDQYPLYNPSSCPFVDEAFSCQVNGRPDSKYTRWRWAPRNCNVPRFNGTDMLERMRGKRLVFVGDSLNRNQWESMLCMLRESLPDKRLVQQIHGGRISKLPGAYVFKFLNYDCKVEFYTSHYLVDKEELNQTDFTVRLDRMDKSERRWRKASILIFNTGHWWTPDKIGEGDNRFQEGVTVYEKMNVSVAYGKALKTWAKWVDTYVNPRNTTVFFRGYSPVHYIGGQWNSGGQCQDETEPIYDESFLTPYPVEMQVLEATLQEVKLPVQVLNITRLSDFRKDAHPATFGHTPHQVVQHQDCSHWCLPGLPDTWNELLYFALVNGPVLSSP